MLELAFEYYNHYYFTFVAILNAVMNKLYIFMVCLFSFQLLLAQKPAAGKERNGLPIQKDSTQKPPISAYKIITYKGDTTYVDTSLTIAKDYKFNYLRKDNFELIPFANVGETYNRLAYSFGDLELLPKFAAQARHYNFMDVNDIYYYEVPTPLTEVYFRTVSEQGQNLDAFFTVNTSPRINFSIAYKGLRSLGKYQNSLTSTGNFRATFSYRNKNDRYQLHTHFVSQDLLNRENGGLSDLAFQQYTSKEKEFEDRSLLEMKYENAENVLYGKRFFLNHSFDLLNGDSNKITLTHQLNFNDQKYIFRQDAPLKYYGETFKTSGLRDEVKQRYIKNQLELTYKNSLLGQLGFKASSSYYNYGYNSVIYLGDQFVPDRLTGTNYAVGADYKNSFGPVALYGDAMLNLVGDFTGYYFKAGAKYRVNENNYVNAEFRSNERAPNFNFLLYQSDYLNYNWYNDFNNQNTQTLSLELHSLKLFDATAEINRMGNYTYFAKNPEKDVKPFQANTPVAYLKVKAHRLFNFGVFSLDNTLMYQNVSEGKNLLNVPAFVTRNSLFYHDYWFQKALFLQTGFTFKYFSKYNMNGYDPVLAEFFVQNEQQFGGYPVVDFFFNAKIKQTRIFFKLEHVNTLINGNNNFVAPDYPYQRLHYSLWSGVGFLPLISWAFPSLFKAWAWLSA